MHLDQIHIHVKKGGVSWYKHLFFSDFLKTKSPFVFFCPMLVDDHSFSLYYVWQRFLWEAWQDLTLVILIVAAVASLILGIKTEVCLVY